ncbi:hypothetical protein EG68_11576 [Paragonimus skrjabini miyazakii]|uniref:Intraflagellar transport protein 122 homolog n=1 Tax=Paragonimus skrjabini miyazakii TaxID=59628 RepID=A0A8S9YJH5_9TREM|nr:hypothetical protein EG68_11576 [Paragonimus skrjabini miyazakii]
MDCIPLWNIKVRGKDGSSHCIWDLCYSPDGSQLLVAAGCVVLVYRSEDADLLKTLRGHKELVYCVDWAYDGKYFSSGSADKCVIIWKSTTLEGLLKYR